MKPNSTQSRSISHRSLHAVICLLWLCCAGGCALFPQRDDPVRFYVLSSPGAVVSATAGSPTTRWNATVQFVSLPEYLRNRAMAVRTGPNAVRFAEYECWGEPLDRGIARVLEESIALVLSRRMTESAAGKPEDDASRYSVSVRVLACEGVVAGASAGSIQFKASWEVRTDGGGAQFVQAGDFIAKPAGWDGRDYARLAGLLSDAVGGLGKEVGLALRLETHVPGTNK